MFYLTGIMGIHGQFFGEVSPNSPTIQVSEVW